MYQELADMACNRITAGITRAVRRRAADQGAARSLQPDRLDQRTSASTRRRPTAGKPSSDRCHVNWVILDSDWEAEFCRVAESHPQGARLREEPQPRLRSAVPLRLGDAQVSARLHRAGGRRPRRRTICLHLVVEIKGYRREDAKEKKSTMETYWVPGVNHLGTLRPLGVRRVHRGLPDRDRFQGQGRRRVQQDDRDCVTRAVASRTSALMNRSDRSAI